MLNIKHKIFLIIAGFCFIYQIEAQRPFFTQYMDNPLVLNPAFAGTRNALSLELVNRQQWLGVKGAPTTYLLSVHSPINDSKVSLGGYLMSDIAGPAMYNSAVTSYAYLVRISSSMFLSLGLTAGIENHWLGLNKLNLITPNDPFFSESIENKFKPLVGTGMVLYSQTLYLGFSSPQILSSKIALPPQSSVGYISPRTYFLTGGARWNFNRDFSLKLACLSRIVPDGINTLDVSSQAVLMNTLKIGASYRVKNSAAFLLGLQALESLWVTYSYDFPLYNSSIHKISNQEITLSYDYNKLFIRNRDREFIKKKAGDDPQIRSIRHF